MTDITKNTDIRNRWHQGYPRKKSQITEVVIHGTGGGNLNGLLRWMFKSGRKGYRKGVSLFHYAIGRKGKTVEIIDPDNYVYHSSSGRHDKKTIGIELLNPNVTNNGGYTNAQYEALSHLLMQLMRIYPITSIVSHNYNKQRYSRGSKNCPGEFDWWRIENYLTDYGYIYNHEQERYYDIEKE